MNSSDGLQSYWPGTGLANSVIDFNLQLDAHDVTLSRGDKVFVIMNGETSTETLYQDLHYYGTLESSRFKLFRAEPSQDVPVFLNFNDSVTKQFFKIENG